MEGVIRGKELEGQIKALEVRVEQANKECAEAKHAEGLKDQENHDLMGHIGRLRSKQSEQSLVIEQLNKEIGDVDLVVKTMMTQAGQYLDSFIQLLNSSTTIQDLLSVTFKERLNQLKRGD